MFMTMGGARGRRLASRLRKLENTIIFLLVYPLACPSTKPLTDNLLIDMICNTELLKWVANVIRSRKNANQNLQRISEELDARTVDVGIGDISRSDVSAQGSVDIGGQVLGGYDHSLGFQSHYATGSTASSFNMRPENSREFSSFHMDTSSTAFGKLDGNICSPSRLAMDSYTGAGNFPPIPLTQTVGNRDYDFLQKLPLYNNQSTSYGCNQLLSFRYE